MTTNFRPGIIRAKLGLVELLALSWLLLGAGLTERLEAAPAADTFPAATAGPPPTAEVNIPERWPGGGAPIPGRLAGTLRPDLKPHEIAAAFLGIPFRADGALDERGRWTLFAAQEKEFNQPGLNCSGFVIAVSRYLLERNVTLNGAAYDRLADSGPESALGADWDFGLDLILNLTESYPRRILAPPDQLAAACRPECGLLGGRELRGVDIHSRDFEQLIGEFQIGQIYFFSISRPSNKFPIGLSHYHVGLIMPDPKGPKWLYHTTLKGRTNRIDLASAQGLGRFRHFFPPLKKGRRMILVIETEPGATPR